MRKAEWGVLCSAAGRNRFIPCDESKNAPTSIYHVREPETQASSSPALGPPNA